MDKKINFKSSFILFIMLAIIACTSGNDATPILTHTVTFDSQGATEEANPTTKKVTAPATTVDALPTEPTRVAYIFSGWYTEIDGGGTEFTAATTVTTDIPVYAKWTKEVEGLEFPFSTPSDIIELAAFGIPNWSGTQPHNGIDLVVNPNLQYAQIISPTAGIISRIEAYENPYSNPPGKLILAIGIRVNEEREVLLSIEPGTADNTTKAAQIAAVQVVVGENVVVGTQLVKLLIGDLGYAHLHYGLVNPVGESFCAYAHSSITAQGIFEAIPKSAYSEGYICYGTP